MPNQKLRSQIVSHRVLNYLNAAYQGKFAGLNILGQLKSTAFSRDTMQETKKALERISKWLDQLWSGETLFDEARGERQTQEAEEARSLLEPLLPDLADIASQLKRILAEQEFYEDPQKVAFVVASYGRYAYAKDNYVRGYLEFGRIFDDPDLIDVWEPRLEEVKSEIHQANDYMLRVKDNKVDSAQFYEHLRFMSRVLPGIFRASSHDIRQLMVVYRGDFTFDKAAIEKHEARLWDRAEVGPIEAGYWRAHGFNTDEALDWRRNGIVDPMTAEEWLSAGFSPKDATEWLKVQFSPLMALQWASAEYLPAEAAILFAKGYHMPWEVNPDDVPRLLQEGVTAKDLAKLQSTQLSSEPDEETARGSDASRGQTPSDKEQE